MNTEKMQIEIWSDIMCPFCFIGKHRFENALANFSKKEDIAVTWKSFELYPTIKTDLNISIKDFLINVKKISEEQALQMMEGVSNAANDTDLDLNWENVIVANTRKAHEMLHLAEKHGVQNELKELLFKAYFVEGKNVDDLDTLIHLGNQVGLNTEIINSALDTKQFTEKVNYDVQESQQLGVSGVPFFVLNRKYAVSGAQSEGYFLQALETSYADWKSVNAGELEANQNKNSCTPGGGCC